jgi:hypothetical protein
MKQFEIEIGLNLKGVQTFEKNTINSPKIFLDMIFKAVKLDGLTCIKKIEVPLHVAIGTKMENPKIVEFEFENSIKLNSYCSNHGTNNVEFLWLLQ